MMREDSGQEARVEMKEQLEGREAREEACRSTAEVGRGGVARACKREYVKEWVHDYL